MGVLKKTIWTEPLIQNALMRNFLSPNAKKYEITNLFVFDWESDYLAVTRAGIFYEVEIKISRADFFNDFKHKEKKHLILEHNEKAPRTELGMPNYFYYAVPDGLIKIDEVPSYAGLIYVKPWGITIEKDAEKLHSEKLDINKLKLCDKFYYNMRSWKDKCESLSDAKNTIKELKNEIKQLRRLTKFYDDELSVANRLLCEANLKLEKYEKKNEGRDSQTGEGNMQA